MGALELDVDGFAVADAHGHADAGRGDGQVRVVQDLPRLVQHLHLFGRVAAVAEGADVREEVEGDGVRVLVGGGLGACEVVAGLLLQLGQGG